ncbi:rod shape-determining protein MreD [Sulfitobacter sp. M57]|uniref:rod shape-determining protein MreD n=1 Tax=unclassified Sulfitobacter TaxID=196795 RepID=UPI0023E0C738|nr:MULTISPECIES: rod shape-determining protein MreD [unclassified Sulfitobacter]MDF3414548.1 rod shape-determining protein MreD [Sulfitobacter sp. KE5]MDF3422029.1 rod shape-determining protein MreD [Sulfitobacter sp. KE43]MDF3433094.1 rod shape-determining protein MreD [Sulfitobacter sp. KE42]MDF3458734.1 rod shape-determining protein MreD [Sulfitobacter sp. S74]MDF3462634.1 rod shape-determining protein MreD [Sulfitobacter sp. Ks18]
MNDLSVTRLWLMRAAFLLLTLVILFFHLLPLETTPRRWAAPDLVLCFALAWSMRRPEYVPALALACAFLLADLLLQRPPGLGAVLALIGCENLKGRSRSLRDANFAAEWISVSIIIVGIAVAYRVIHAVVLIEQPSLSLSLSELFLTLLVYPIVVAITHVGMGVRKASPGDLDGFGHRI